MKDSAMTDEILWQTKLHARLHDPAEKALVLLRDPAGHEGGNSRVLWRLARADELPAEGLIDNDNAEVLHAVAFSKGIKPATYKIVQRADWCAAAADRPQWPMQEITVTTKAGEQKTLAVANFARVNWAKEPQLVHPLTGAVHDLARHGGLSDSDFQDIKQRSFAHFSRLLARNDGVTDFRKSALAFWRFGPQVQEEEDFGKLGALWQLLPADTRVPDHGIWDHLDLTSAFAGAFAADPKGEAALLSLAIGPVQSFIEAARTTSDLWAGSHLLARLSWEAMKPVCEELGPDAVLFPRLRGVPQVDLWLRDECGLDESLFKNCDWNKGETDANPLFGAALPNRFVAVVPASRAKEIAATVEQRVRRWLEELGAEVVDRLLKEADHDDAQNIATPHEQMKAQLAGFPEVHWAAVPFSLICCRDEKKQRDLDTSLLSDAMRPFFTGDGEPGFLSSPAWKVLQKEMRWEDNTVFFSPNPGVLYPAIHELAERALAAAKTTRRFAQTRQEGWRCSLTGETEWLTTDRKQLHWNQTRRKDEGTLWTRIASQKPAWAKKGEHLGGLAAIKRLWPTLFAEQVSDALGKDRGISRFVVSTHTMALAGLMGQWLEKEEPLPNKLVETLTEKSYERVAMPKQLAKRAREHAQGDLLARIPAWLDAARESDSPDAIHNANRALKQLFGKQPETYYSLLLMDGDHMGAWLAGGEKHAITYRESFHGKIKEGIQPFAAKHTALEAYFDQKRALSPNRHLAISGALNDFSLTLARFVVEEEHAGRLIYAGGDDVLAMLPVMHLLPAMQRLRRAYSGHDPEHTGGVSKNGLTLNQGFASLNGRLMRLMGERATASIGAVIAHHQAPLGAVLRELHTAEKRAKNEGGRDAFCLTVIKRSGGALTLIEKWGKPVELLCDLRDFLASEGVSRRAVYHTLEWLNGKSLPAPTGDGGLLQTLLAYQLKRQANGQPAKDKAGELAPRLTDLTLGWPQDKRIDKLRNFLSVAEFLARETRADSNTGDDE